MKYLKFIFVRLKKLIGFIFYKSLPILSVLLFLALSFFSEGYTLEDLGIYELNLNPNDYCNLTDVDYTAVLHDNPDHSANVEITEYLTFDVHAASKFNPFKELWRELPEEYIDGLPVTYNVKSVTQILPDGQEIPYKQTSKMYWEDQDYTRTSTYYWHHSTGSGIYPDNDESLLIYIPWTYREKMTFKIVYSMNNAALRYNDCSELYLSMYSGNTIKKLNSFKAQILIPKELMPTTYHAYTFGTSKNRILFKESNYTNPGYHTFSIDLNKSDLKFNYHNRYIEFCLLAYGDDKHIFTQYAPYNRYYYDNVLDECIAENEYYEILTQKFSEFKIILLIGAIIISPFIILNTKNKIKKLKEKHNLNSPEFDYEYFREIPSDLDPIFASELVFMKNPFDDNKEKKEEYAAVLLSLVRKKYVTISKIDPNKDWDEFNTKITLTPIKMLPLDSDPITIGDAIYKEPLYMSINEITCEELEPLSTSERLYYELLERYAKLYDNVITLAIFQRNIQENYLATNSFIKDIEKKPALEIGVIGGYFSEVKYDKVKKELEKKAKKSLSWGLIFLIIINFISYFTPIALAFGAYTLIGITLIWKYFYLNEKMNDFILFSQFGVDEQAKWHGLYNFLNSDTLLYEKEVPDITLWEKYLIYATAFGISKKVIKALKINAIHIDINTSPILNNHFYIHSNSFHKTSRAFGHSLHTSSRGGGGFGGHGGYGGGGRGGGGGGGGH